MSSGGASGATAYTGSMAPLGDIGFGAGNYGPGYSSLPSASPSYASGNLAPLGDIGFGEGNLWPGGSADKSTDWAGLAKMGGALADKLGNKGGGGGGEGGGGSMASAGQSASSAGRPGGGGDLFAQVVQQMLKRQQMYAANTNPQGATAVDAGRARGILGV